MKSLCTFVIVMCFLLPTQAHAVSFNNILVNAADRGNEGSVIRLVQEGFPIDSRGSFDVTPLMRAAFRGYTPVASWLLTEGASPNLQDIGGATALHLAVRQGHYKLVKLLLEHGANANVVDADGWTPLMRAALHIKKPDIAYLLIAHDAEINQTNVWGQSTLMLAARSGNYKFVEHLINRHTLNKDDIIASAEYALQRGHSNVVTLLRESIGLGKSPSTTVASHSKNTPSFIPPPPPNGSSFIRTPPTPNQHRVSSSQHSLTIPQYDDAPNRPPPDKNTNDGYTDFDSENLTEETFLSTWTIDTSPYFGIYAQIPLDRLDIKPAPGNGSRVLDSIHPALPPPTLDPYNPESIMGSHQVANKTPNIPAFIASELNIRKNDSYREQKSLPWLKKYIPTIVDENKPLMQSEGNLEDILHTPLPKEIPTVKIPTKGSAKLTSQVKIKLIEMGPPEDVLPWMLPQMPKPIAIAQPALPIPIDIPDKKIVIALTTPPVPPLFIGPMPQPTQPTATPPFTTAESKSHVPDLPPSPLVVRKRQNTRLPTVEQQRHMDYAENPVVVPRRLSPPAPHLKPRLEELADSKPILDNIETLNKKPIVSRKLSKEKQLLADGPTSLLDKTPFLVPKYAKKDIPTEWWLRIARFSHVSMAKTYAKNIIAYEQLKESKFSLFTTPEKHSYLFVLGPVTNRYHADRICVIAQQDKLACSVMMKKKQ